MPSQTVAYAALTVAVLCEVAGITCLQKSEQFTRLGPTLTTVAFYVGAFYLMTHALKVMPLAVVYAVWSGAGIVLTALVGILLFMQPLDLAAVAGIALIVGGVVLMQSFSAVTSH